VEPLNLETDPVTLEWESPLERILFVVSMVLATGALGLAAFAAQRPDLPLWKTSVHLGLLAALGGATRAGLRIDHVLDTRSRRLLRRRRLFGNETSEPLAPFEELDAVAVECQRHVTKSQSWLNYRLVLVRRDGSVYPASQATRDCAAANEQANRLARFLTCAVVPGAEGRCLEVEAAPGKPARVVQAKVEPYLLPQSNSPEATMKALAMVFALGAASYGLAWLY
jgi:hypothetical protein